MRGLKKTGLLIAAMVTPVFALAQAPADREVTWAGDVAAIFQEKCQEQNKAL